MGDNVGFERPPAETIREVDLHLRYLQGQLFEVHGQLAKLVAAMPHMATKADIDALATRLQGYATKTDLEALRDEVRSGSVQSTFDRWLSVITRVGSAAAVIAAAGAALAALVHYIDRIPK